MSILMKRKRSNPSFSSSFDPSIMTTLSQSSHDPTMTSSSNRLPLIFPQSKPASGDPSRHEAAYMWKVAKPPTSQTESPHLDLRTRKRWRDNRPDEQAIHTSTMSKLFEAQRSHPNASPIPSNPHTQPHQDQHQQRQEVPQKSTLHSFWRLPNAPPQASPQISITTTIAGACGKEGSGIEDTRCEDCDRPLGDDADDMMDLDEGAMGNEMACLGCGRWVCGICAVMKTEGRMCLGCAR